MSSRKCDQDCVLKTHTKNSEEIRVWGQQKKAIHLRTRRNFFYSTLNLAIVRRLSTAVFKPVNHAYESP